MEEANSGPGPVVRDDLVTLHVLIPRSWRDALAEAAGAHGISMAALCRLVLRGFLRERYNGRDRALLEHAAGGHGEG